jgi:hypothetical protein
MFATVSDQDIHPVRSSDIEKADLANATKAAVNMVSQVRVTVTTAATGAFAVIWTSEDMAPGSVWSMDYHIVARATAGLAARARYDQAALFYREIGGATSQQGASGVITSSIESIIAWTNRFRVVGNAIVIEVLDDGVCTVNWDAFIEVREVR